jgi:hypothetical protein
MKLMAARTYKNDFSDVVGIVLEQRKQEKPLTIEDIKRASVGLYDAYERLPEKSRSFIEEVFACRDLQALYNRCRKDELSGHLKM